MPVIRVNKTSDYTIMSNTHLRERDMTLRAKGLLSLMLSLPDDWDYSVAGLCSICTEKKGAVTSTLSELQKFGYLRVTKMFPGETSSGRIEYVYDIYETPQDGGKQGVEKQDLEKQGLEEQELENPPQLNTNKSITKESNTNKSITEEIEDTKRKRFVAPTVDEVRAYCLERKNSVDAERFVNYYTSNGWHVGKKKMVDWKATVRTWESNGYNQQKPQNEERKPEITEEAKLAYLRALRGETGS